MALALPLVLALACGDDDGDGADMAAPDMAEPADLGTDLGPQSLEDELSWFGPHLVGFRELEVTYARPDGDGDRTIPYLVWYPASAEGGRNPSHAFRRAEVATVDAPPATGSFPTLAFSHGHLGVADVSTDLCEHFASHGWVVFSPTHVGNTTADGETRTADIYYLRSTDVSAALDDLEANADLGSLVGSPMVISGHSFGGYTAVALAGATFDVDGIVASCETDPGDPVCTDLDTAAQDILRAGLHDERFDAVISMGGGDSSRFGDTGVADIDIPVLVMVAEGDGHPEGTYTEDDYWNTLDGPGDLWVNLLGAGHQSFTDICATFPAFPRCPEGEYDAVMGQRWTFLYAHAFVRSRLMDDAEATAILEGMPEDPSLEVVSREP
jgi:predicted dienelactone hydrolase